MTEVDERIGYWRDQVDVLLKSGGAIVILFAGWAIDHHEGFLLNREHPLDSDKSVAAVGLLTASLIYAVFLIGSVCRIYARPLQSNTESTVLRKRSAVLMSIALAASELAIAALISLR